MSNTILVTGATGTIGRQLVQQLNAAGLAVIGASSSGKNLAGVTTRHADFAAPASLATAFAGIDRLFLLLPLQPDMVDLARNAVAAAKAAGIKHIVRSSAAGADADSPVAVFRMQGEADRLVIDSGIAYTITRPGGFMQNFDNFYGQMIRAGTLYLPQGDAKTAYIDVRDIAASNARILQNPAQHAGKVYTLTGGAALSNAEAMAIIGKAVGRQINYVPVPDEAAIAAMRDMGMDEWLIDIMINLHRVIAAGNTEGVSPDVATLLDRAPISFENFATDHAAAWK